MKLYDSVFEQINSLLEKSKVQQLDVEHTLACKEADKNAIIFKSDEAYELGEGNLFGISGIAYCDDDKFVNKNEAILIGNDLIDINNSTNYARIALIKVKDDKLGEGNAIYQALRKIDYTRYHVNAEGFMLRISSMNSKESLRVSKDAIKQKISFANLAKLFIGGYLKHDTVEAVKIIFITDPTFDYKTLNEAINKSENITLALDHLLNKVKMDCHSCKLQTICNEVEELCKEDFKANS